MPQQQLLGGCDKQALGPDMYGDIADDSNFYQFRALN